MRTKDYDQLYMQVALALARYGERQGEVPVGAVLVRDNTIYAMACNNMIGQCDPSAHAEIIALRKAARATANYRLPDTTMYVTLEPCAMCAGALIHARIKRLVYACYDPRTGAVDSVFNIVNHKSANHQIIVEQGLYQDEASAMLRNFFLARR